jgi:hypothetical protein
MGRPRKYWSQEERDEARRLQTRLNVRAHRERQKQLDSQATYTRQSSESSTTSPNSSTVLARSISRASTPRSRPVRANHRLSLKAEAEDSESDRTISTIEDGNGSRDRVMVVQYDSAHASPPNVTMLSDLLPDLPEELVMKNSRY